MEGEGRCGGDGRRRGGAEHDDGDGRVVFGDEDSES